MNGVPGGTRTRDLEIRNLALYPPELRALPKNKIIIIPTIVIKEVLNGKDILRFRCKS